MHKYKIILIFLALAVILGLIFYYTQHRPVNTAGPASTTQTNKANTYTSAAETNQIVIQNFQFQPNSLSVKVGATVTWINHDTVAHTVTSSQTNELSSGDITPNNSYTYTFTKPGQYNYNCNLHRSMLGSITVTQ